MLDLVYPNAPLLNRLSAVHPRRGAQRFIEAADDLGKAGVEKRDEDHIPGGRG